MAAPEAPDYGALIAFPEHPAQPESPRLQLAFGAPRRWFTAHRLDEVRQVIDAAQAAAQAGAWCIGHVAYEAAPAFDRALAVHEGVAVPHGLPLAAFAVFDAPLQSWPEADPQAQWQCGPWQDALGSAAFAAQLEDIQEAIRCGEVYQVNLTTRLSTILQGDALPWFLALLRGQPLGYAAYLRGGPAQVPWGIASVSPELFFDWRDGRLTAQPMKGTAARGATPEADAAAAQALLASEKERAENLMIVDLLRNDFARIARTGSVTVPRLFELHALPTLWQMTSTVQAQTREGLALSDVFAALFPCGSVTGAPKIQAMRKIRALEPAPRGVYCGAVGVIAPGGAATFNVPIRTAVFSAARQPAGDAPAWDVSCGIGSGITLDSSVAGEAAEWRAKQRFLLRAAQPFKLLESLRLEDGAVWLLEEHLQRLQASARALGFACDADAVRSVLETAGQVGPRGVYKLRLLLSPHGGVQIEAEPLQPPRAECSDEHGELRVGLAAAPIESDSDFVRHKTTQRSLYQPFKPAPGEFDVLLWNAASELTEFTIGNLALKLDGRWLTPELGCGLLAGTYRAALIQEGKLQEARLTLADLQRAEAAAFINSVRGWLPVQLAPLQAAASNLVLDAQQPV